MARPTSAAVSPDLRRLLVGRESGEVTFIDLPGGRSWTHPAHEKGAVTAVALSRDGRLGFSGGDDQVARLWDLETAADPAAARYRGRWKAIEAIAFLGEGRDALVCDQLGAAARLGPPGGSDAEVAVDYLGRDAAGDWTLDLAVSADGRVALRPREATVELWSLPADGAPPERLDVLQGHDRMVRAVALSADGRFAASGAEDKTVRVWRLPDSAARGPAGRIDLDVK
jgi:WD40 repeat protein